MPATFDAAAKRRYVELISRGRRPLSAAEDVGFTWRTVKEHLKSDREFNEAVAQASDRFTEQIEEVLADKALEGDFQSIKLWLLNRKSIDWQDTTTKQVQHVGPGGGPIQIAATSMDEWRNILSDPEARAHAITFAGEIPAIETTAVESG